MFNDDIGTFLLQTQFPVPAENKAKSYQQCYQDHGSKGHPTPETLLPVEDLDGEAQGLYPGAEFLVLVEGIVFIGLTDVPEGAGGLALGQPVSAKALVGGGYLEGISRGLGVGKAGPVALVGLVQVSGLVPK